MQQAPESHVNPYSLVFPQEVLSGTSRCLPRAQSQQCVDLLSAVLRDERLQCFSQPEGRSQNKKKKGENAAVQGYARLNQAEAALDVMRDFWQQGGEPDDSMFEVLVTLCVRTGEFRKALQVVHAMDKLGRPADKMRIKKVLEEFYRY